MKNSNVSLDDLFESSPDYRRPPRAFPALMGFLGLSIIGGLILGLMVKPITAPINDAVIVASNYWNALPSDLPDLAPPQRSNILDINGNKLAEFFAENRVIVGLETVSPYVVDALVSTEDRRFYEHAGIDWRGLGRATVNNVDGGDLQGASTITQQLVKNTLVVNAHSTEDAASATETSIFRKIEEVKYARALENKYTKDQIMERYLNVVLYANGVYGIGTAAQYYFNIPADQLTLPQAALLVGLLKNPTGYDPIDHPAEALERRAVVLSVMVDNNKITQAEADAANLTEIGLIVTPPINGCSVAVDPYYCQLALNSISEDPAYGATEAERKDLLYRGGLTITTYYDPNFQNKVQVQIDDALGRGNRVAAGVAVIEPGTGILRAVAQNRTWGMETDSTATEQKTQVIYPDRVSFQSGSTFKIFTLAAALEAGFTTSTIINAPGVYNPGNMNVPSGGIKNVSSIDAGPMDIYTGTARSSNTFYATLAERVGVLNVADMAESLGLDVPREGDNAVGARDASFTLGTISVSPIQMASAYAAFAAGGIYCSPVLVKSVTDSTGVALTVPDGDCHRVVSPQTAANVSDVLASVIDGPDSARTGKDASIGRPVAGKTGTTNNQSAVWFAGYTPQYATAVWVGDPRGGQKYPLSSGLRFYGRWTTDVWGSTISGPIWESIMKSIHEGVPVIGFPGASTQGIGNIVPDVRGMEIQAAVTLLTEKGYIVTVQSANAEPSEFSTPDHVASQNPVSVDSGPKKDNKIELTLTNGSKLWSLG